MIHSALYANQLESGRCTAFDEFTIVANPLGEFSPGDREKRSFPGDDPVAVTYGSHALYLLRHKKESERGLFVGVHSGLGQTVWRIPACYNYLDATLEAVRNLPEKALYSLLWGVVQALADTRCAAIAENETNWIRAALDKRIRTRRRPAKGTAYAWIEPEKLADESERSFAQRKRFASPPA